MWKRVETSVHPSALATTLPRRHPPDQRRPILIPLILGASLELPKEVHTDGRGILLEDAKEAFRQLEDLEEEDSLLFNSPDTDGDKNEDVNANVNTDFLNNFLFINFLSLKFGSVF